MNKARYILYAAIGIPVLLILIWIVVIPEKLVQDRIESAVTDSGSSNLSLSFDEFKKGVFFNLYAGSLNLKIDDKPALRVTDFRSNFAPRYLTGRELAFTVTGKIGTGSINGILKLPADGKIVIEKAELDSIPYLTQFGLDINGYVSSEIEIGNESLNIIFNIPDLIIDDNASVIPLLNTFRKLQGALSIQDNTITINSVSLEGEKGYARLKGSIINGKLNLTLEVMPDEDKLTTVESMLIGKYVVSPGYYVIPIRKLL
jgi:hypothetical protein